MKHRLQFWLGILFSAAGLVLAVRVIDLQEAWSHLTQIDYLPLIPAFLALTITLFCKSARWRYLFDSEQGLPAFGKVFSVLMIGQMVNFVMPLRVGEVARAYYIGEMTETSKSLAVSTIVVEKAVDTVALLALGLVLLFSMPLPTWLQGPLNNTAVVGLALLGALVLIAHLRRQLAGLLSRLLGLLPSVLRPDFWQKQVERLLDGLRSLRQARVMAPVAILTIGAWLSGAITNHYIFLAMGVSLPFVTSAFLLMALQVGTAVPAGPSRVVAFQYITVLALSVFAVGPEKAFGIGVVLYLLINLPPTALGLIFLWQHHLSLWNIKPVIEEG